MSRARRARRAARGAETAALPPDARSGRRSHQDVRDRTLATRSDPTPWVSLGLLVAVAGAYWPVRRFGFVRFDDPLYVTENPHVLGGLTLPGLQWAFTSGHAANWHPVTWLSHMLDVQIFGVDAGAHHAMSALLHVVTSALLFSALFRMTRCALPSLLVAALFALHPLHVESVAWVAERKDVLSACFWMLTLLAYDRYVRNPAARRFGWVVLFFALGLMSKPMVVTLPFVLLLLDAWPLRRLALWPTWASMRPMLLEKLPLFALSAASAAVTVLAQSRGGAVASSARLPLTERLGNAVVSYGAYIGKMLWPAHLAAYYPYPDPLPATHVALGAVVLVATSVVAVRLARRRPYVLVGWLWYLGTLVPVIGIVQVGTQAMADRYSYLPLVGLFVALAWALHDLTEADPRRRRPVLLVAGALVVLCTAVTRSQVRHWESSRTLWTHALAVKSGNYAAHTYLGNALANAGSVDSAIAEYAEALRLNPDFPEAHNNLGPALVSQGRTDAAISHFAAAIRLRPDYADAHNNLGVALASQGKLEAAVAAYREALRIDPEHAHAHGNLGLALFALGRTADARAQLSLALQRNPARQDVRTALGRLQQEGPRP